MFDINIAQFLETVPNQEPSADYFAQLSSLLILGRDKSFT
jgi:hypothetical protein